MSRQATTPEHQLPQLAEPAHWGVFFTRNLVPVLGAIVALLGGTLWLAASNTQVEQSHSATLVEQGPCADTQPAEASEMLCIQLSLPRQLVSDTDAPLQLRVEFENPTTYTRTSRDTRAEPLEPYSAAQAQLSGPIIYQARLARPAAQPQLKQLLVISNTTSAWSRFCAWLNQRLPQWQ